MPYFVDLFFPELCFKILFRKSLVEPIYHLPTSLLFSILWCIVLVRKEVMEMGEYALTLALVGLALLLILLVAGAAGIGMAPAPLPFYFVYLNLCRDVIAPLSIFSNSLGKLC